MSKLRTVHIVRHGATLLNSADAMHDRLRGWMDVPLSNEGKREASLIRFAPAANVLFTSDLTRATETAAIIASRLLPALQVRPPTPSFRPWNIGEFAGRSAAETVWQLGRYADQKPLEPVPGGESFDAFRKRFLNGLFGALASSEGVVAIVTHHRCERLLQGWAKYGFRLDGSIDQDEFTKKGEHTGQVATFQIPLDRLFAAALAPQIIADIERCQSL